MGWGHMGNWGDGWGMGWGVFGFVHMILWALLLLLAVVVLAKWIFGSRPPRDRPTEEDRAIAILRERYARGEIGKEEFEARRRDLTGG